MIKRLLLRALLLAGIGTNVAFLLINLRPQRPHLGIRRHVRVLLRATADRAKWVKANEIDEFAAANDLDVEVATAESFEDIVKALHDEKEHPKDLLLAAINDELTSDVIHDGSVRAVQDSVDADELAAALQPYLPEAVSRSRGPDGKVWFLPKRGSMDIVGYLRPAVEDAYLNWEQDRPAINAALAEANGVGLPKEYALSKSPDNWDTYDLFVAGWYWAHHPAPWASPTHHTPALVKPQPRLAWRVGPNDDAVSDLLNSFYRHGFTQDEIGKIDRPAVIDALQWEAVFRKNHLLVPEMDDPKGLDGDQVSDLLQERRIAFTYLDQEDSLYVHGGARRDAPPGLEHASDLGWSTTPAGVSLELAAGQPAREGKSHAFLEVHLWAIPARCKYPRLAVQLASFLTQRGLQQRETEAQGLLPIRQDLSEQYPIVFRLDWIQRMLDASYHQIEKGASDIPDEVADKHYDDLYTRLRARVVGARPPGAPVTLQAIRAAVTEAAAMEASHVR